MSALNLTGSVGRGGDNHPDDVTRVSQRLVRLGFKFAAGATTGKEWTFIRAIRVFQSIINGSGGMKGDGLITTSGRRTPTLNWLESFNAPGWVRIIGRQG